MKAHVSINGVMGINRLSWRVMKAKVPKCISLQGSTGKLVDPQLRLNYCPSTYIRSIKNIILIIYLLAVYLISAVAHYTSLYMYHSSGGSPWQPLTPPLCYKRQMHILLLFYQPASAPPLLWQQLETATYYVPGVSLIEIPLRNTDEMSLQRVSFCMMLCGTEGRNPHCNSTRTHVHVCALWYCVQCSVWSSKVHE